MLKLNPIAGKIPAITEIETEHYKVLFSYKTPVAYIDKLNSKGYETNKKWSRTTTRHIYSWFNNSTTETTQSVLDKLL